MSINHIIQPDQAEAAAVAVFVDGDGGRPFTTEAGANPAADSIQARLWLKDSASVQLRWSNMPYLSTHKTCG